MEFHSSQADDAGFLEGWEAGETAAETAAPTDGEEAHFAGAEEEALPPTEEDAAGKSDGPGHFEGPGGPGTPGNLGVSGFPGIPGNPVPGMPWGPAPAGLAGALEREARVRADLRTFATAFPDAARSPAAIPPAVWDMVRGGRSLTAAYAAFQAVRDQAGRRNAENAARSTGSMRSAGSGAGPRDPFLEGWES